MDNVKIDLKEISNPFLFEDLCRAIVFNEYDKEAEIFGRSGKDFQIDSYYEIAENGQKTIFSFKFVYHDNYNDLKANINNDKRQFEKYINENNATFLELWKNIKNFYLYTNCNFNPTQLNEITKILSDYIHVDITIKYKTKLENIIKEYPWIYNHYFYKKESCFLPFNEFAQKQEKQDIFFKRYYQNEIKFRDAEIEEISQDFLNTEKKILIISGKAGFGKTRLLLSVVNLAKAFGFNERILNTDLSNQDNYLKDLNPKEKYIFLIDDANEQEQNLFVFIKQYLIHFEKNGSKILLVCRSIYQENITIDLSKLIQKKEYNIIELKAINEELDCILLNDKNTEQQKKQIIQKLNNIPFWLMIADYLIQENLLNDLNEISKENLSKKYIKNILKNEDIEKFDILLPYVAVITPFNYEDDDFLKKLSEILKVRKLKLIKLLETLFLNGIARKKGRMFLFSPDLIKDYILINSLLMNNRLTGLHDELINSVFPLDPKNVLKNLFIAEEISGKKFLDKIIDDIEELIKNSNNRLRYNIFSFLEPLAVYRPQSYINITSTTIDCPSSDEYDEIYGTEFNHNLVLEVISSQLKVLYYYNPHELKNVLKTFKSIFNSISKYNPEIDLFSSAPILNIKIIQIFRDLLLHKQHNPIELFKIKLDFIKEIINSADGLVDYFVILEIISNLLCPIYHVDEFDRKSMIYHYGRGIVNISNNLKQIRDEAFTIIKSIFDKNELNKIKSHVVNIIFDTIQHTLSILSEAKFREEKTKNEYNEYFQKQNEKCLDFLKDISLQEIDYSLIVQIDKMVKPLKMWFNDNENIKNKIKSIEKNLHRNELPYLIYKYFFPHKKNEIDELDMILNEIESQIKATDLLSIIENFVNNSSQNYTYNSIKYFLFKLGENKIDYAKKVVESFLKNSSEQRFYKVYFGSLIAGMHSKDTKIARKFRKIILKQNYLYILATSFNWIREWKSNFNYSDFNMQDVEIIEKLLIKGNNEIKSIIIDILDIIKYVKNEEEYLKIIDKHYKTSFFENEYSIYDIENLSSSLFNVIIKNPNNKNINWYIKIIKKFIGSPSEQTSYIIFPLLKHISENYQDEYFTFYVDFLLDRIKFSSHKSFTMYRALPINLEIFFDVNLEDQKIKIITLKILEFGLELFKTNDIHLLYRLSNIFQIISNTDILSIFDEWVDKHFLYEKLYVFTISFRDYKNFPVAKLIEKIIVEAKPLTIEEQRKLKTEISCSLGTSSSVSFSIEASYNYELSIANELLKSNNNDIIEYAKSVIEHAEENIEFEKKIDEELD